MAHETWVAWKTVLDDRTVYDGNPSATIRPGVQAYSESSVVRALLAHPDGREELTFSDTLGTGGMGVVRLAEQRRMGREVAVKSLRSDVQSPDAVEKLLAEGWVTGTLEHPNIVPVYDIAVDPERRPHIVMKRISGIEWGSVMDDADRVRERFGAHDLLSWNLGILQQVCNAVQFAHARSIVHRDLKPENVMIGAFGEVYVVDWGIAVTLDPADERIPVATPGRVAGTPRYMAPEMVRAAAVDRRTDIYLLGGVLHRILAGRPPHSGWSIREILEGIPHFSPDIPGAPEELVSLVRDAMAPDPADRPAGVEVFAARIATYLEHRGSTRLSRQAHLRLKELQNTLDREDTADRQDVYGHLGACRFGFREALEAWPDNPSARAGLDRALACVAEYELAAGDPRAAAVLLDEMRSPPARLRERVDALEAELRAEESRLQQLKLDNDPSIGMRTRLFVVGVLGLVWTALPFSAWFVDAAMTSERQLVVAAILLLLVGGAVFWARESFLSTPMNRLTAGILAMVPTTKGLIHSAFLVDPGASFRTSMVAEMVVYTTLAAFASLAIDRRFWPSFLVFLAGTVVQTNTALYPMIPVGVGSAVLFVNALFVWLPEMPTEPRYRS
jgi:serine/threonine-protein kinase